jgi:8-oxo-dGTP diphosphatase
MKLRLIVTAFIKNNGKILMIKRSENKKIAPGLWAGLGGHVEPSELNTPEVACLREIFEESGLSISDISNFKLKCIILRNADDFEIRQQFVYFGETNCQSFIDTDEGKLYWINESDLLALEMPKTCRHILSAYLSGKFENDNLYAGISIIQNSVDDILWTKIEDFDKIDAKNCT